MMRRFRPLLPLFSSLLLLACSSFSEIDEKLKDLPLPQNWHDSKQVTTVEYNWLSEFDDDQVHQLVEKALTANHQFAMQAFSLKIAEQQLIVSGSELWPELDLAFSSSRSKSNETDSYTNSNSINLNLIYEVDILGKLSDVDRASNFDYLAQKSSFDQYKQQLVADVITTWFDVIEADKLLTLYRSKAENSKQNLAIIESGYRSGLIDSLDVYLTRNSLNSELSVVSEQETVKVKLIRALERLIGEYPKGTLFVDADLPVLTDNIPVGLPSELISRKPELKASWYQLLSQDAGLAYAHKQRFPSIILSGSLSDAKDNVGDLLSTSSLAWSLLGSVSAPIFNAGRLKANEEKARFELKQGEQLYLDTLYSAFSDVENAITTEKSLKQRYETMLAAQENAKIAAILSFEQYQSGLVSYTTVLDAQNSSYEAQATLIKIKSQLLANRINLHLALGGNFSKSSLENKAE
jgi:NodT family efflux transporter outer membrane factor (OMF) lipoprotein